MVLKKEYAMTVSRKRIGRLLCKQWLYTKGRCRRYNKQRATLYKSPKLVKQNKGSIKFGLGDIGYIPFTVVFLSIVSHESVSASPPVNI